MSVGNVSQKQLQDAYQQLIAAARASYLPPAARTADPHTSHEAVSEPEKRVSWAVKITRYVRDNPGAIRSELAFEFNRSEDAIGKRISDAVDKGWIYTDGSTATGWSGKEQQRYFPTMLAWEV